MSIRKSPGDFEVELPGEWLPCDECDSTIRVAFATLRHPGIGFTCGKNHILKWRNDNGSLGLWIPHYHFWPNEQFEGTLPLDIVGEPKSRTLAKRFEINERRRDWIHNFQPFCVVCRVPPMHDYHEGKKLLHWLKDHHAREFDDVTAIINLMNPKPKYSTWREAISREHVDLSSAIHRRIRDSILEADHGIPIHALKDLWPSWTRKMRELSLTALAFGYCRPHNNGKSKRIPNSEELMRLHLQINYNGLELEARAAIGEWKTLERVLDSLEQYRESHIIENASLPNE
jgi:hypothetical protein